MKRLIWNIHGELKTSEKYFRFMVKVLRSYVSTRILCTSKQYSRTYIPCHVYMNGWIHMTQAHESNELRIVWQTHLGLIFQFTAPYAELDNAPSAVDTQMFINTTPFFLLHAWNRFGPPDFPSFPNNNLQGNRYCQARCYDLYFELFLLNSKFSVLSWQEWREVAQVGIVNKAQHMIQG